MISVPLLARADGQIRFGTVPPDMSAHILSYYPRLLKVLERPLVGGMARIQKHIALLYKL